MQFVSQHKIVKASGEEENYDESKVIQSLAKSGLSVDVASQALDYLKRHLKEGLTTRDIYQHLSAYLKDNATRDNYYNFGLKRSIMALGPSGHPFERLVGDLLESQGYDTSVSVVISGKCVTHEIDVIAVKGNQTFFIECKYHNAPGVKSDVQVALYTYARFLDIETEMKKRFGEEKDFHPWIMTNTKLTYDAIDYAICNKIEVTTWGYPKKDNLHDMLLAANIHPVTVIESIPKNKLQQLLDQDIVTCNRLKHAIQNNTIQGILTVPEIAAVISDLKHICKDDVQPTN